MSDGHVRAGTRFEATWRRKLVNRRIASISSLAWLLWSDEEIRAKMNPDTAQNSKNIC